MKKIHLNGWQRIGIIASVLWFFIAGCHHRHSGARPAGTATIAAKHAPLPDELIRAKSVYIVNQTGYQEVMDHAYEAFSKWNRFSIAKSKDSADAVVVFTLAHRRTIMSVYVPNLENPVFQTTERRDAFSNFGKSAKKCVDDLKSRFKN